jgi:ribosomal protein S18 acetylase RimI-like enzyme
MNASPPNPASASLRPAVDTDTDAIAALWHRAWPDGHRGNVPDELLQHRDLASFHQRVPARISETTVAVLDGHVVGFVMVHDDEIEQIYVDTAARGGGVAKLLLQHGEARIGERFEKAWLAVVAGNARARHFYENNGWGDAGLFDYEAEVEGGTFAVPVHRYEKPT